MAVHNGFNSFSATGLTVTVAAASASVAIPVAANGQLPKFVRIQANAFCYIRLGGPAVTATTNDYYLSANNPEILVTAGSSFIASIQDAGAAKFTITPLEA